MPTSHIIVDHYIHNVKSFKISKGHT